MWQETCRKFYLPCLLLPHRKITPVLVQLNVEEMRWYFLRITIPYVMLVTEYQKVFTLIEKHLTSVLAFNDMTCIWDGRPVRFARASRLAHDRNTSSADACIWTYVARTHALIHSRTQNFGAL